MGSITSLFSRYQICNTLSFVELKVIAVYVEYINKDSYTCLQTCRVVVICKAVHRVCDWLSISESLHRNGAIPKLNLNSMDALGVIRRTKQSCLG